MDSFGAGAALHRPTPPGIFPAWRSMVCVRVVPGVTGTLANSHFDPTQTVWGTNSHFDPSQTVSETAPPR